jgi:hypothetical protein
MAQTKIAPREDNDEKCNKVQGSKGDKDKTKVILKGKDNLLRKSARAEAVDSHGRFERVSPKRSKSVKKNFEDKRSERASHELMDEDYEDYEDDFEDPGNCFCKTSKGGDVISCAICQRWCHPTCVGLSAVRFEVLGGSEAPFVCPLCVLLKFSKEDPTTKGIDDTKADVQRLTQEFELIKKGLDKLTEQVSMFSSTSPTVTISEIEEVHGGHQLEAVSSTVKEQERKIELHDRQLRSKNVVVFGLKEDNSQDEVNQFRSMLAGKLGMESEQMKIEEAFRLGKQRVGGTRSLLVKLEDKKYKSEIMNRCHLLKGSGIFINRDYTALQRRNLKIMVTRMKKAKEDGCNDVFITRHGVLMLEGSNLGSVDDFELVIGQ